MKFDHFLGKKLLSKLQFENVGNQTFMSLTGTFFYKSENASKELRAKLQINPQETLGEISRFVDGAFILIFVDEKSDALWGVSDPYGLEKIYYRQNNVSFLVSDSLEDFEDSDQFKLNSSGLNEYLRFLDISPPATCFEGIRILDGGTILKFILGAHGSEIIDCVVPEKNMMNDSFDVAVERTRELLLVALEKRLKISGKIGLLLSGGVDSSLLAGLLSEIDGKGSSGRATAYTVGFDDEKLDESSIAEAVAEHLNLEHKVLKFSLEEEYQAFFDVCNLLEVPFADPAVIPTYLSMQQMRKDGVSSVMEGTGADGLIGAILPAFYHRILRVDKFFPRPMRMAVSSILKWIGDPKGYLPYFEFDGSEEPFIRWKGWTRSEIEELTGHSCDFSTTAFYRAFSKHSNDGGYELYRKLLVNMPDYRITDTCRLMGFDPVFPFFDQGLRDYVESLPIDYKCRHGEKKALFKAVLSKLVPRNIWDVPKHGFDYPFEKLLLFNNADLINRYLDDDELSWHDLFNREVVFRYKIQFLDGDLSLKFKVWALVVFQAWYEGKYIGRNDD